MHWLIPTQIAALAATLLLASAFYYFYWRRRKVYLRQWAAAWAVYASGTIVEMAGGIIGIPMAAAILSQCMSLLSGILLLSGTYAYVSKPFPMAWITAGGIGLLCGLVFAWRVADLRFLIAPPSVVISAAYAWTGRAILRARANGALGQTVAGWAFVLWSVLQLTHPVWVADAAWEEWGFLATALLEIAVAVGFLVVFFEDTLSMLTRSAGQLRQLVQDMPVLLDAFDENLNFIAWNRECERVTGYTASEIVNNPRALETLYPDPVQRSKMLADFDASGFNFRDREWEITAKNGERRTISWSNPSQELPIPGWHTWAVGMDVTQRRRVEQDLRTRAHQQETVALLGQVALTGVDTAALFKGAVQSIARELGVDFCEILELAPEGDRLIFRAGLSNVEHLIDRGTVAAGQGSQAGFTLLSREPVIMADIDSETRFTPHHFMREHGIVSGMSAVIGGSGRPFGVLNASTTRRRAFTKDDTLFLQSLANVLAAAIERKQAEEALHRQEQAARKSAQEESVMSEIGRIIGSTLNIGEVYEQFAAEVKRILPFDRIAINLVEVEAQKVTCQFAAGLAVEGRMPGDRFDLAGTATAACIAAGRGMLIPSLPMEELKLRYPGHVSVRRLGIQTSLLAPLVSEGKAFGALVIMSTAADRFAERDIALAENVAARISGAVAHARLLDELLQMQESLKRSEAAARRLVREKAAMAEIARIVGSTLAMEDVYERFSEEVRKIISFDRITITRIHPERATAQILYSTGPKVAGRGLGEEYPLAGTMSADVVEKKTGMAYSPAGEQQLAAAFPTILPMWTAGFRSFLLVPLIVGDRVLGTLVMSSYATDTYGPEDVSLAGNIASQISGAVANAQLFAEHTRMANALRESEASLKSIFRVAPIGIGVVDALLESEASLKGVSRAAPKRMGAGSERILVRVNDRMCEMLGYAAEEMAGKSARMLYPTDEDFDYVGREKYIQIREKGTGSVETRWRRKDGTVIDVLLTSTPIDSSDISRGLTFTALDITAQKRAEEERRKLEERLRQAQKMEAIGTLAGGIAHDFNNILAAIVGFGELARMDASANAELTASIDGILKASFRARDLVRQILTFSRQNEAELFPVQPHLVVKEAVKLLRASLPSTIRLQQTMNSQAYILGDPTQIQQVVMNLCTNAYHAMREEGGELEVALTEVCVDNAQPPEPQGVTPGMYLKLSVRDTGRGIDPAFIHRIFDPYFTTKEKTKGTGLGLAVVHGIVKSHKGAIQVSSLLGAGTTFEVYFPIVDEAVGKAVPDQETAAAGGCERILFVDDEPDIEDLGRRLLGSLGYGVATCQDGGAALDLFGADPARFDLVITDMTMPGMTGDRLAVEMLRIRPGLPVILCTGFNELINMDRVKEIGIRALMMKPFLKNEMAKVIREVLERR